MQPFLTPASTEIFRRIAEKAHHGIVLIDRSGKILVFNQSAGRITRVTTQRLVGKNFQHVFPELWPELKEIFKTKTPQLAKRVRRGGQTFFATRTPVIKNDVVQGVLSIFQDLSEYEKILTKLKSYRDLIRQLNVIINSSYDGLWICDREGKVVRVNSASEKLSGIKEHEVVGRSMRELVDEGLFDRSASLEVLKKKGPVNLMQRLRDGRRILVTGNPVLDDEGNIDLVVVNARDISELNRLHHELEESRALTHRYRSELSRRNHLEEINEKIIVRSAAMKQVLDTAVRSAGVDVGILITGESGVGKGLVSELIHAASPRKKGPFIRINCGAIPESLIEAELFGYEKGAFTGALGSGKPGYFEMAEGGTLFLDEIGELPLNIQIKLLRFLESNEVTRLGAVKPQRINVRVIAATNRKLREMVHGGTFRNDLYFRLNVVPIRIPPLRERIQDIPPLINLFLQKFNRQHRKNKQINADAVNMLCEYRFPGNIRELHNLLERLVVLTPETHIEPRHLPKSIQDPLLHAKWPVSDDSGGLRYVVSQVEKKMILRAMEKCGSQRAASRLLGINHTTLSRKLKRLNIHPVQ